MSATSDERSADFLKISAQFKLGDLITESSHPVTVRLSDEARESIAAGLGRLFEADEDVLRKYAEFISSGVAARIADTVLKSLKQGGKIFFTGCGSTGRLSIQLVSIWRDFWQQEREHGLVCSPSTHDWENRAFSVMAGGDFALIKSVEGFEDFTAFGKKQLADLGVSNRDVVFAITEGGETSFVIGTAWQGVEAGAKVYFVYNNPDEVLCRHVERSREVIADARIEKINLTTGPMAITGSTRMQATTIQLCVVVTILEMLLRNLFSELAPDRAAAGNAASVPAEFLAALREMHATLKSNAVVSSLARLVSLEESVYRAGHKNNYYADRIAIDVLTDTTERSPTYCTPPFRKFDDATAAESWAFLFVPQAETPQAWTRLLKRPPNCVEWSEADVRALVTEQQVARTTEIVRRIRQPELMRFRIGLDGPPYRRLASGDCAVAVAIEADLESLLRPGGFHRTQLEAAHHAGARTGLIFFGTPKSVATLSASVAEWDPHCIPVLVALPKTAFLLDGVARAGVKMLLNALSTCTMVRLGRVMGNYMIWVVPSNLKLIDRATRYIQKLTGLAYDESNRLLFEVIEYVEPRMKSDRAYPPVVGMAVLRRREQLTNEQAEQRLNPAPKLNA
jgi:N-acetylmuramic acid 6-phosphate etherase